MTHPTNEELQAAYKFKSNLVKKIMPLGVTDTSHVKRNEVSKLLNDIKLAASNDKSIYMFAICRIEDSDAWDEESILIKLKHMREDISALKFILTQ